MSGILNGVHKIKMARIIRYPYKLDKSTKTLEFIEFGRFLENL